MAIKTTTTVQALADFLGLTLTEVQGVTDMHVTVDKTTKVPTRLRVTYFSVDDVISPTTGHVRRRLTHTVQKDITLT